MNPLSLGTLLELAGSTPLRHKSTRPLPTLHLACPIITEFFFRPEEDRYCGLPEGLFRQDLHVKVALTS